MGANSMGLEEIYTYRNKIWHFGEGDVCYFWAVKKFEYELRGRKFKIETDHKAFVK